MFRFHSEPCGSDGQTVVSSLRGESCARPPTTPPPNSQFSSPSRPSLSLRQVSQAARKRRRSDAGLCSDRGPRKKSHVGPRLHIGPRLHAVSDSFIPHMDPNTHPFFRRVIQADPPFSPQSPCPSSESASDQLPLSQGCTGISSAPSSSRGRADRVIQRLLATFNKNSISTAYSHLIHLRSFIWMTSLMPSLT